MKALIKYGVLAVGGYLAYSWYKKRQDAKKDVREVGLPIDVELPTNEMGMEIVKGDILGKPLKEQSAAEINGDNLTIQQKEEFIVKNGDVPLFEEGDGTFFSADGDTDDVALEAALSEEEGEEGFGSYILSMRAKHAFEDAKCGMDKIAKQFPSQAKLISQVKKDYTEAIYVLIKCRKAQRRGEKGCENIPAVQAAAKKRRNANAALKAIDPRAIRMIMRQCAKVGKLKRGFGAKASSRIKGRYGLAGSLNRPMIGGIAGMIGRNKGKSSMNGWD